MLHLITHHWSAFFSYFPIMDVSHTRDIWSGCMGNSKATEFDSWLPIIHNTEFLYAKTLQYRCINEIGPMWTFFRDLWPRFFKIWDKSRVRIIWDHIGNWQRIKPRSMAWRYLLFLYTVYRPFFVFHFFLPKTSLIKHFTCLCTSGGPYKDTLDEAKRTWGFSARLD